MVIRGEVGLDLMTVSVLVDSSRSIKAHGLVHGDLEMQTLPSKLMVSLIQSNEI